MTLCQVFHSWLYLHETLFSHISEAKFLPNVDQLNVSFAYLDIYNVEKNLFNMFFMHTVPLAYIQSINYHSRKKHK